MAAANDDTVLIGTGHAPEVIAWKYSVVGRQTAAGLEIDVRARDNPHASITYSVAQFTVDPASYSEPADGTIRFGDALEVRQLDQATEIAAGPLVCRFRAPDLLQKIAELVPGAKPKASEPPEAIEIRGRAPDSEGFMGFAAGKHWFEMQRCGHEEAMAALLELSKPAAEYGTHVKISLPGRRGVRNQVTWSVKARKLTLEAFTRSSQRVAFVEIQGDNLGRRFVEFLANYAS